jgi:hypothetical protein
MMEYMFFDAALRDRFVEHARGLGVACTLHADSMGGLVVGVPEDLSGDKEAEIEACYDALQEEQSGLVDQSEGGLKKHLAGFRLELPDGQSTLVALQPDFANRLLDCFSLEEIQALFAAVAMSALRPQDGPLCQMKPDK